ncbi:amidohydrolase family protein [Pseudomonas sp. S75]|uniref:amidohydrolase family protein n=1 Tax=unclassified Pseudomonas TaxID=196821 RepID=UPI001906BA6D|nr:MULTISPECIES: amidohydrolase family protein [unclassified Pseudomonas]MBJ9978109.1 amidohydrolase family protein [Pseudomonas sp. S30]MBK0155940.1 amidohydrolase family protein [Pseudomonas sp. S75]
MNTYTGPIFDAHIHTEFASPSDLALFTALKSRFDIRASMTDSTTPGCSAQMLRSLGVSRCAVITEPQWCAQALEQGLRDGLYTAIKINVGFMPVSVDDPRLLHLYTLAQAFDVPVLLHTGDTGWDRAKLKYAHPLSMDEVITDHPHVKFLLVHSGNPWFTDAAVVAAKNKNVWLDTSSIIEGSLCQMSSAKLRKLLIEPISWMFDYIGKPDRLVFGSGWPSVDYPNYLAACAQAIEPEYHLQVFFENARHLFNLAEL